MSTSTSTDARPRPQRPFTPIPWYFVLFLTIFIFLVYAIGIALYLRSPIALEQRTSLNEPSLGFPQQPPYFQLKFTDLSPEHLFFTMRWTFLRNLILTYDWFEFHYNASIVGLREGVPFRIRSILSNRAVFEFEGAVTTEYNAFAISDVRFDEIVVTISFDHFVRALVGIQHSITFARSETVYWLVPVQTVVELVFCFAVFQMLIDTPCRILGFQIWSFVLVVLVVLALDRKVLEMWWASPQLILVTQQAVGRVLEQFFRAYVLVHLEYFTGHGTLLTTPVVFWTIFFAGVCGVLDYWGTFDGLAAVQASHAIELPWGYGEMVSVVGDLCFAGCALAYLGKLLVETCLDGWQRWFWAVVVAGTAVHGVTVALMRVNRDFVSFAGGMAASVMYGTVSAVLIIAFRPVSGGCGIPRLGRTGSGGTD